MQQQSSQLSLQQSFISKFQKKSPDMKYPQYHTYTFPITLLGLNHFKSLEHIKQLMRIEAGDNGYHKCWRVTKNSPNKKDGIATRSIYLNCRKCKALLVFKKESQEDFWSLKNYSNTHIHSIANKADYKKVIQEAIIRNINSNKESLFDSIKNSYPMNQNQFTKLKKGVIKKFNFDHIKKLLKQLTYQFKVKMGDVNETQQRFPHTLVAVSEEQRNNYRKYGQIISYDITYNLIKQITAQGRKFGVGIFSGFDNNNRIVVFGFSLNTFQKTTHFKTVFKWFFDLMGFAHTTAIITDQQKSLISALAELKLEEKYKYHHIYDNWHFIRSYYLLFKMTNMKQQLLKCLKDVMKQSDPNVGKYKLNLFKDLMIQNNLEEEYHKFENKRDKVCLWEMPKQFLGLSLHSNQGLNNLLKLKVEYQLLLYQFIEKFDQVSQERTEFSKKNRQFNVQPYETIFDDEKIKEIRQKFEKKVFHQFIINYNRSQFYQTLNKNKPEETFIIKHLIDKDQYTIKNWECECGLYNKIGIACQHLIYIWKIQYPDKNYIDLIKDRWLPQDTIYKNSKLNRRYQGRGSRTRRNHIR